MVTSNTASNYFQLSSKCQPLSSSAHLSLFRIIRFYTKKTSLQNSLQTLMPVRGIFFPLWSPAWSQVEPRTQQIVSERMMYGLWTAEFMVMSAVFVLVTHSLLHSMSRADQRNCSRQLSYAIKTQWKARNTPLIQPIRARPRWTSTNESGELWWQLPVRNSGWNPGECSSV